MSTLFRFLTLLLCLEMIVSPIAPHMSLIAQNAHAEDCPTGFTFDSTLNRCLTKTETANVMNATMACGNDIQCYKQNAQQALQDKVNSGEAPKSVGGGGFVSGVANILAVAGPVTVAVAGMAEEGKSEKCQSYSFWAMIGGSVALFVGDNLANMQHKSRLKKIKEDWGKIVNPEQANGDKDKERQTSIEAQSQSFEMLARAEDSLAKAAKMKKTFFTIAAAAYGVSGLISVMEMIAEANPTTGAAEKIKNTCSGSSKPKADIDASQNVRPPGVMLANSKIQIQMLNNLSGSEDIAAFILNKEAMDLQYSSPSIVRYEEIKTAFAKSELKDPSLFKVFKDYTIAAISNLNPVQTANATEPAQATTDDSSSGQNSASSSNPAQGGVNTNAAKAFKEDTGKGLNLAGLLGGAAIGVAAGKMLGKNLVTSQTRAIFAGVMMGMSLIMASHAGKQAEASEKRAELLRKMRDEFASASGAIYSCKSEDRNDPAKPNCYCYTAENQRNTNRGNSQICQKLWAGINTKASNYTASSQSNRVCVNMNRQADATCACKATNTCMKVSLSSVKGLNAGTMSILGSALTPQNGISNGSIDAASVDNAALANLAAKIDNAKKSLEGNKALANYNKNKDKAALKLKSDLSKMASNMNPSNALGGGGNSGMPSNPGQAANMLEKELADQIPATSVSGGETITTGSDSPAEQPLEFGLTGDQLAAQEGQLAEVMKQDLDYGGNDINQGSKTNIFEVLSNRYQRSGMRRLFDEKGETKPEAAAKSDITQ